MWLESHWREEIEIDRLAVPQAQCDRRAAVKNEMIGGARQLGPKLSLRLRKNVKARRKYFQHTAL
jgi:hypothetical protein